MKIKSKKKTLVVITEPNLAFLSYPITDLERPLGHQEDEAPRYLASMKCPPEQPLEHKD
jgi:hypothetical protein